MKAKNRTQFLTHAALIAALYVVLTYLANLLGLANYAIQVRFSEALTILPVFTAAAIPGLTVGCLLSNILISAHPFDTLFGTLATLLAAVLTYLLRRRHPVFATLPPIFANAATVPFVLIFAYGLDDLTAYPFFFLTVGIGEVISAGILGLLLYYALRKRKNLF
ncbi:MAG: QueT transporter family protein [Clostridia bacterium]|nr:QueT transporter family protein [Clostridia bacterium]